MKIRVRHKIYYLALTALIGIGILYYLLITRPLIATERAIGRRLAEVSDQLAGLGYGMTASEILASISRVQADIDRFRQISRDPSRLLRFDTELEAQMKQPFQLVEFDQRKFLILDNLQELARRQDATLFDEIEDAMPTYTPGLQRSYMLWAQLGVIDQLVQSAVAAGVARVDHMELISINQVQEPANASHRHAKIPIRMRLTGPMDAIHGFLMMLPLNGDEARALGLPAFDGLKSPFFIERFILIKSSRERADEVTLEFVASGLLDLLDSPSG